MIELSLLSVASFLSEKCFQTVHSTCSYGVAARCEAKAFSKIYATLMQCVNKSLRTADCRLSSKSTAA